LNNNFFPKLKKFTPVKKNGKQFKKRIEKKVRFFNGLLERQRMSGKKMV
jgi:hypothetical protein